MSGVSGGKLLLSSVLLLVLSWPAKSQLISFGIKGGVPLADPLETGQGGSTGITHDVRRYIVGPTGELHLPFGFSVEVDALYRGLNFTSFFPSLSSVNTSGSDWQFPLLAKYEFRRGVLIHPFVDAGVTFRHVSFSNVSIGDPNTAGISIGGGLTAKLLFFRLSPEFRYTRFPTEVFGTNFTYIHSTSNQIDFLVGFTF
jgi:hypothetical protein